MMTMMKMIMRAPRSKTPSAHAPEVMLDVCCGFSTCDLSCC
jgi:hypothetical protein